MPDSPKNKVFISHVSEEKPIGVVLKEWIEDAFADQVSCFVSSVPVDLPGGKNWLNEIATHLRDPSTKMMISVLSPRSVGRHWIVMEFGAAWIRNLRIYPFCHSGLAPASLPRPLSDFQGGTVDQPEVGGTIVHAVADATGLRYPRRIDFAQMQVALAESVAASVHSEDAGRSFWDYPTDPSQATGGPVLEKLDDESKLIVTLLAHIKDNEPDHWVMEERISRDIGLKRTVTSMRIRDLLQRALISVIYTQRGSKYSITEDGVALLLKLGALP